MIVLGIDIGVTGALAAVDGRGSCQVVDLPTVAVPGKAMVRRRLSPIGIRDVVRELVRPGEVALALIEDVHMRPGNGGAATASLLHSRGVIEAVLELQRVEVRAVQPAVWKRWYGLIGQEKGVSLERARVLYPTAGHLLKRQKDHNRGEALLIAHYGQQVLA